MLPASTAPSSLSPAVLNKRAPRSRVCCAPPGVVVTRRSVPPLSAATHRLFSPCPASLGDLPPTSRPTDRVLTCVIPAHSSSLLRDLRVDSSAVLATDDGRAARPRHRRGGGGRGGLVVSPRQGDARIGVPKVSEGLRIRDHARRVVVERTTSLWALGATIVSIIAKPCASTILRRVMVVELPYDEPCAGCGLVERGRVVVPRAPGQ